MSSIHPDFSSEKPSLKKPSLSKKSPEELLKAQGYLFINPDGNLDVTENVLLAKSLRAKTITYLDQIEKKTHQKAISQLKLRLLDESKDYPYASTPSSELTLLLGRISKELGIEKALNLMCEISKQKQELGLRYNSVDPWPKSKDSELLHLIPNLSSKALNPSPKSLGLLGVMEPDLEPNNTFGKLKISDAELLILDKAGLDQLILPLSEDHKKRALERKRHLDDFYKHKVYLPYQDERKTFYITNPTAPYAPDQFLILTSPNREDILTLKDREKTQAFHRSISTYPSGSKTLETLPSLEVDLGKAQLYKEATQKSINSSGTLKNVTDVESMLIILKNLPDQCFIGQNSPETSSDANYQHFQLFLSAPVALIPLFSAKAESFLEADNLKILKLSTSDLPTTTYKFAFSSNDLKMRSFLKAVQDEFLKSSKDGSSMNVVIRKISSTSYECYFILRKSILTYPELQHQAVAKGSTRPGWMEMCGVRLAKSPEEFQRLPDQQYKNDILSLFALSPSEESLFRDIVQNKLKSPL